MIGTAAADRPFLHHCDGMVLPGRVGYNADTLINGKFPGINFLDRAFCSLRRHNFMGNDNGFRLPFLKCPIVNAVPCGFGRGKLPFLFAVERRYLYAAADVIAHKVAHLFERTLNPVKHLLDQARPQFYAERLSRCLYRSARAKAGGLFVDLDGRRGQSASL